MMPGGNNENTPIIASLKIKTPKYLQGRNINSYGGFVLQITIDRVDTKLG